MQPNKKNIKYYVVDAFAEELFKGNSAGVCVLEQWLEDDLLQNIAFENNLAETAFVVKRDKHYELRWFTPDEEVDLCGHATLATAFVVANFVDKDNRHLVFDSQSGILNVFVDHEIGLYTLDFPSRKPVQMEINPIVQKSINAPIREAHLSRDLVLVVDTEEQVKNLDINFELLRTVKDCFAFVVTAPSSSKDYDFVSRFFMPDATIIEDPVTGSAHCSLIPFWAERLNKNKLIAKQLSKRGGTLYCENNGERVKISGKAKLYLEGEIKL